MEYGKTPQGESVELYVLNNGPMTVKVITYGGRITELHVPDRHGKEEDIVLGFDDLSGYLSQREVYFGALIGRVANRIAGGEFTLDGKDYRLPANDGPHSLHGGRQGFYTRVWKAEELHTPQGRALRLTYESKDGEEGYPGNLTAQVTYTVTADSALHIEYQASTDKPTLVNLTSHSYFNLAGASSGDILAHELMLAADQYTPVDDTLIPTGEIKAVTGTPLDFTRPTSLGARIRQLEGDPGGYDHNFVLRSGGSKTPVLAVRARDPRSGRVLELFTTEPGVQLYSGNFLDGTHTGKGGAVYRKHQGFCLEPQHFPDAVHQPHFPSIILRPGKTYTQTTITKFSTE